MVLSPAPLQFRSRNLQRLQRLARRGGLAREVAFVLAGLASVLRLVPARPASAPLTGTTLVLGAVLVLAALLAGAPLLGLVMPVLAAALVLVPGALWPVIVLVLLVAWLRRRGRLALA